MLPENINKLFIQFLLRIGDYEFGINSFKKYLDKIKTYNPLDFLNKIVNVDNIFISSLSLQKCLKININKEFSNDEINFFIYNISHIKDNKISKKDLLYFITKNSKYDFSKKNFNEHFEIDKELDFKIDYCISRILELHIKMLKEKLAYLQIFNCMKEYSILDLFNEINMKHKSNLSETDISNFFSKNNIEVEYQVSKNLFLALKNNSSLNLNNFCIYMEYDPIIYNNKLFKHPEINSIINNEQFIINWEVEMKRLKNLKFKIGQTDDNVNYPLIKINKYKNNNNKEFKNGKGKRLIEAVYNENITNINEKNNMIEDFCIFIKELIKYEKIWIGLKIDLILRCDFNPYEIFYYINYNMKDCITLNEFIPFIENDLGIKTLKKNYIILGRLFSKNTQSINLNNFIKFFTAKSYKSIIKEKENIKNINNLKGLTSKTKILLQSLLVKSIETELIRNNLSKIYNFRSKLIYKEFQNHKGKTKINDLSRFIKQHNFEINDDNLKIIFERITFNKSNLKLDDFINFWGN